MHKGRVWVSAVILLMPRPPNEKVRMDREYEENNKLEEERQKRMELEFAERKAMLELIQKLFSK